MVVVHLAHRFWRQSGGAQIRKIAKKRRDWRTRGFSRNKGGTLCQFQLGSSSASPMPGLLRDCPPCERLSATALAPNVLARRKTVGTVRGAVLLNGQQLPLALFHRFAATVDHGAALSPKATVLEALRFSAALRLPRELSPWLPRRPFIPRGRGSLLTRPVSCATHLTLGAPMMIPKQDQFRTPKLHCTVVKVKRDTAEKSPCVSKNHRIQQNSVHAPEVAKKGPERTGQVLSWSQILRLKTLKSNVTPAATFGAKMMRGFRNLGGGFRWGGGQSSAAEQEAHVLQVVAMLDLQQLVQCPIGPTGRPISPKQFGDLMNWM